MSTLHGTFMLVVRTAQGLGLATGMELDAHERRLEIDALPHIEATLARLKTDIQALPVHVAAYLSLVDQLVQTQAAAAGIRQKAPAPPHCPDVERRGARAQIDPD